MKIIQGLKSIKELQRKVSDLRSKIKQNCADMDHMEPTYGSVEDQKKQIESWIQSTHDSVKEIMRLRVAIQKTNLETLVKIKLGDKIVEHSITEWIHRRRELAEAEMYSWSVLTIGSLAPKNWSATGKPEDMIVTKPRMYFNPKERDDKIELYTSEPGIIDSTLEVTNAETDLIE